MDDEHSNVDTHALPSGFIGMNKPVIQRISVENIVHFISSQPQLGRKIEIKMQPGSMDFGIASGSIPFNLRYDDDAGPVSRDVVLHFAPTKDERLFHEYDIGRQFRVQQALFRLGEVPVQEPLWQDADGSVLGTPGLISASAKGLAPRSSAFALGPLAVMTDEQRKLALRDIHRAQIAVHNADIVAAGLEGFEMNAPGETPILRAINWYWLSWEWFDLPNFSRLMPVYSWLKVNAPARSPELTHGAAALHNYLFQGNRLATVRGWELSCLCHAEADLALQCLGNQVFAVAAPSLQPPSTREWLEMYEREGGRRLQNFAYYSRLSAYVMLVAFLGMNRYMPPKIRKAQKPLIEKIWEVAEA